MSSKGLIHDSDYYFGDGNVVLLVESVLFKVHRSRLTENSSTFATLFRLPNVAEKQPEGGDDTDPIVLHGDTAQQFRSLLWGLYALPNEIIDPTVPHSHGNYPDFDRYCDLSLMAHKYCFNSLETWARRWIYMSLISPYLQPTQPCVSPIPPHVSPSNHLTSRSPIVSQVETPTSLLKCFRRILKFAILCDDKTLYNTIMQRLQSELQCPDPDFPWFVALAEEFQVHALIGTAYYTLMLKGHDRWIALGKEGRLTGEQLGKLHGGYYLFVLQWEQYRAIPPNIPQCTHYDCNCVQKWEAFWWKLMSDDIILNKCPADVVGRLQMVLQRVSSCEDVELPVTCRKIAYNAVQSLLEESKRSLSSKFLDAS